MTIEQLLSKTLNIWDTLGLKNEDVKNSNYDLYEELNQIHEIDSYNLREVLTKLSEQEDPSRRAENIINSVLTLKGLKHVDFIGERLFEPEYGLNELDKTLVREAINAFTDAMRFGDASVFYYRLENVMQLILLEEIRSPEGDMKRASNYNSRNGIK